MHITVPQQNPFQIAELVEAEQRMVAGASEVPVVGGAFLIPVRRTDGAFQVENQNRNWLPSMNTVYPLAGQIHQDSDVLRLGENLRLKAAHLAR